MNQYFIPTLSAYIINESPLFFDDVIKGILSKFKVVAIFGCKNSFLKWMSFTRINVALLIRNIKKIKSM